MTPGREWPLEDRTAMPPGWLNVGRIDDVLIAAPRFGVTFM